MPLRLADGVSPMTYLSTEYVESDESPQLSYYMDRGQVMRRIQVDWDAKRQACLDFHGANVVQDNGSARWIARTLPHPFPGEEWMRVNSVPNAKGLGAPGTDGVTTGGLGVARYDCAELTLVYGFQPYFYKTDEEIWSDADDLWESLPDEGRALEKGWEDYSRYVSKTVRPTPKTLVLNKGLLRRANTYNGTVFTTVVPEGIPFPATGGGEVLYTWHNVPRAGLPTDIYRGVSNVVNDVTFDGYQPGCLLYDGNYEFRVNPNPVLGVFLYDVTYKFHISVKVDPVTLEVKGHNHIWSAVVHNFGTVPAPDNQRVLRPFELRINDGNGGVAKAGDRPFPSYSFRKFFRPNPV
jgi:hypothetical protein